MKKTFSKYFVVTLSLMLILSNFSYATQLMICEMSNDAKDCACKHIESKKYDGISLTQERSNCCSEERTELTNSNTLQTVNNDLNHNVFTNVTLFFNTSFDTNRNYFSTILYYPDKSHLPKLDIPVLTSSLLI